ncbi:MAG: hypothetical protein GY951_10205, partial [Psychromonas sp.]|nr:hypothetical protein [Psychromonas sp.]
MSSKITTQYCICLLAGLLCTTPQLALADVVTSVETEFDAGNNVWALKGCIADTTCPYQVSVDASTKRWSTPLSGFYWCADGVECNVMEDLATLIYTGPSNGLYYFRNRTEVAMNIISAQYTVGTGWTNGQVVSFNVAPSITSTAGASATEDVQYTYTATVIDADDANNGVDLTWSLTNAPSG